MEARNVSVKVTSIEAFVQDLMNDCVKFVSTEGFVEVASKEAFVKVTSMGAFAQSFVHLTSM